MKNFIKTAIGILMTGSLILSPAFALAKNKEAKNEKNEVKTSMKIERNDNDNQGNNNKKSCKQAWGHLFAFGWLKKHNAIEIDADCFLPFGISKKFGNQNHASTTPDTIAPVITNLAANTRIGEAVITWNTDENSDSTVYFSATNVVNTNSSSTPVIQRNDRTKNHRVVIGNLSAGTTYYVIVKSKDKSGNSTNSSQISFVTKTPSPVGDSNNPTIQSIVGVVSTSTIKIGWKTNEFATSKVYYSLTSPVSTSSSNFVESSSLTQTHLVNVPNLANGTKYFFVVESKDIANNVTRSNEFSFTTQGSGPVVDTTFPAITNIVTTVSSTTINVTWNTNETATSKIYYNVGATVDPNSTTTPFVSDNTLVLSHNLTIPSLATSTQYTFVVESKDGTGNRTLGPSVTTTTSAL